MFKTLTRGGYGLTTALTCLFEVAFDGGLSEFFAVVLSGFSTLSAAPSCSSMTMFDSGNKVLEADAASSSPSGDASVYITA